MYHLTPTSLPLWAQWTFAQVFVMQPKTKLTNTCVSAQLKPCYVHIQISFSRGSGVSVPKWIVGGSYLLYNKYDLLMVIFLVSDPQTQRTISLHLPPFFLHGKKKKQKNKGKLNIFALYNPDFNYSNLCTSFVFSGGRREMTCLLMWHDTRRRTALHRRHLSVN